MEWKKVDRIGGEHRESATIDLGDAVVLEVDVSQYENEQRWLWEIVTPSGGDPFESGSLGGGWSQSLEEAKSAAGAWLGHVGEVLSKLAWEPTPKVPERK